MYIRRIWAIAGIIDILARKGRLYERAYFTGESPAVGSSSYELKLTMNGRWSITSQKRQREIDRGTTRQGRFWPNTVSVHTWKLTNISLSLWACGNITVDEKHILFYCRRFATQMAALEATTEEHLRAENITHYVLHSEKI